MLSCEILDGEEIALSDSQPEKPKFPVYGAGVRQIIWEAIRADEQDPDDHYGWASSGDGVHTGRIGRRGCRRHYCGDLGQIAV